MKKFPKMPVLAVLAVSFLLGLVGPMNVFAATSPSLGAAATFSVLSGTAATNTGATSISGDLGVSPAAAYTDAGATTFLTPGNPHLADLAAANAQLANTAAFGSIDQPCTTTYAGVQDLTLVSPLGPGVYCSTGSFILTGNLTLTGTSGVWIFKSASTIITSPGSSVTGGDPCNVWWRAVSSVTLDTTTNFIGNILASTQINMNTGATLNGRAFASTAKVGMQANTISGPVCTALSVPENNQRQGTINVVKTVVNDNGGTKVVSDFPLFVSGTPVVSGVTNTFPAPAGVYFVTETSSPNYTSTFSGDCDDNGGLGLSPGDNRVCIVTNNDIGPAVAVAPVPPLIDVVKVPSPLSLPAGPGTVNYTYTVRNIGTVSMTDVTMVGDTCSPIVLGSGDTNSDAKLDVNETWVYHCSTTLNETHTNTVVATGWANGISATDIASATVVVGQPLVPPLIHLTKVPSPLTLKAGGGMVTYTEKVSNPGTVALNNIVLTDDKCGPMKYISGDTNVDLKLDVTETWTYTCQSNLTQTTTNTAIATGEANGFTVRDIAVATVVVPDVLRPAAPVVPKLPRTGVEPLESAVPWNMVILTGSFAVAVLFTVTRKKQKKS